MDVSGTFGVAKIVHVIDKKCDLVFGKRKFINGGWYSMIWWNDQFLSRGLFIFVSFVTSLAISSGSQWWNKDSPLSTNLNWFCF